jgi:hypothetical protein
MVGQAEATIPTGSPEPNQPSGIPPYRNGLALCFSPFQASLLSRIACQYPEIGRFRILYLTYHDSPRDRFYFARLTGSFARTRYLVVKGKRLWRSIPAIRLALALMDVRKGAPILVASVNAYLALYIVRHILFPSQVYIYDDGAFSILSKTEMAGYFRAGASRIGAFLGRREIEQGSGFDLLERAAGIFTVFPGRQQLVPQEKEIAVSLEYPIFAAAGYRAPNGRHCTVFVGDVVRELSGALARDYVELIEAQAFDYYLPHPRCTWRFPARVNVIGSELLAEDFIASLLEAGFRVTVFSFSSTVLFLLQQSPAIRTVMIRHEDMSLPTLYGQAADFGIEVVAYSDIARWSLVSDAADH